LSDANTNDTAQVKFLDYESLDLPHEYIKKFFLKTVMSSKSLYYYDPVTGIYRPNGDILIEKELEAEYLKQTELFKNKTIGMTVEQIGQSDLILPKPWTKKAIDEFLGHVQRRTYIDINELNAQIEWLACADCMLNLKTGETAPFDPKYLNTTQIPVKYAISANSPIADFWYYCAKDPKVDSCPCPKIMKFLNEIMAPEDVEIVLDFIAYCLWREYKFHAWLLFNGAGQNGKSTLLTLIERLLGHAHVSGESLDRLLNNNFATANLYQKLVNVDADLSGDILKNTGKLKKLTGSDEYPAEFKFKPGFKFRNYAKLIFSCNEFPQFHDKTDAFFRRLIIINFIQQFLGEKEDRDLIDKLSTEEELSGLLYEVLRRLPRVLQEGIRPTTSQTMEDTYDKYIRGNEPVRYFADKAISYGEDKITVAKMYESYGWFCRDNNLPVESEQSFSRKLKDLGYLKKQFRMKNGDRPYCWYGVKLLDWKVSEDTAQETLEDSGE
jgi:putative DNA primase/helicase